MCMIWHFSPNTTIVVPLFFRVNMTRDHSESLFPSSQFFGAGKLLDQISEEAAGRYLVAKVLPRGALLIGPVDQSHHRGSHMLKTTPHHSPRK